MNGRLLGVVDLDGVWLDDRQRCRWALRGVDLTLEPRTAVAIVDADGAGGGDGILDLVAGRRVPSRGTVSIDGTDVRDLDRAAQRRATVELLLEPGGERRLCLPDGSILVARPSPATVVAADVVVVLDDGLPVDPAVRLPARAG